MKLKAVLGNWKVLLALLVAVTLVFIPACAGAPQEPLKLGITPWSCTIPQSHVAKIILVEELGYEVEVIEADLPVVVIGMSKGDIDMHLDAWFPTHWEQYYKQYEDTIESCGLLYDEALWGWGVSDFGETDIESIGDLKGYEKEFDYDGDGLGDIYGLEPGCETSRLAPEVLEAYGLAGNWEYTGSSEWAMLAQLDKAYQEHRYLVFALWEPHWAFGAYEGIRMLKETKGFYGVAYVNKMVRKDLAERAPEAYRFLSKFEIPKADINYMINEIERKERDPDVVAREWIEKNQEKIAEMLRE